MGIVTLVLLLVAVATLRESRGIFLPSEDPTLADIYLTRQASVGAVMHLRARYTNTSTDPADVRLRLFGTRREFTVLGPLPPSLMHVAPGQQLSGDIAFIVGQPGSFGGEFVVTDEGFVKLAEQPFPELSVRPVAPLALFLGALVCVLSLLTVAVLIGDAVVRLQNGVARHRGGGPSGRRLNALPIAAGVGTVVVLGSVVLAPVLRQSPLAVIPLLVTFPAVGCLVPAVAFWIGNRAVPLALSVGASAVHGALLAYIATGSASFAPVGLILGGAAAALGWARTRRLHLAVAWVGGALALGIAAWGYGGWETYHAQIEAIIGSMT